MSRIRDRRRTRKRGPLNVTTVGWLWWPPDITKITMPLGPKIFTLYERKSR